MEQGAGDGTRCSDVIEEPVTFKSLITWTESPSLSSLPLQVFALVPTSLYKDLP